MASQEQSKKQTPSQTQTKSGESKPANERRAVRLGPLTASSVLPAVVTAVRVVNRPENKGRRKTD